MIRSLHMNMLNKFDVQEGNKRVSVMKFVGAYSIAGSVTRLVPKRSEDREVKLYYEFMDFYQISLNCDVTFSEKREVTGNCSGWDRAEIRKKNGMTRRV